MTRAAVVVALVLGTQSSFAEPTPQKVDIKPFRDELLVFVDAAGNSYVVKPYKKGPSPDKEEPARLWFGAPNKPLYEQSVTGRSANGDAWDITTWAPRIDLARPGYFQRKADGTFEKWCGNANPTKLTQLTGDKAKAVLDKTPLMTEYLMRRAHMLARDDRGTYYYVDHFARKFGGKGFRVFVGKKGAMKQQPLTDVATDTAGEVFSTKSGDLRLDHQLNLGEEGHHKMVWIRGEKRTELVVLDVEMNSSLIFTDLGIYSFLGTICDTI